MKSLQIMADGNAGGGPTVVLTMCAQMRANGMAVAVVTAPDSYLAATCRAAGIEVFEIDFSRRAAAPLQARALARIIDRTRPDIVHAHGARSALPVALLPRRGGAALVYTVHGFHHTAKRWPARPVARRIERLCAARAAATIYVGEGDHAVARRERLLPPTPHRVVYNGVSVPAGLEQPWAARRFDLAFLARLTPQKDPLILPDILLALRPLRPSLLVIGDGELGAGLRQAIADHELTAQVTFAGALPRDAALPLLAQARIFLLPSLWEGLPVSLVEAMRLRLAVVGSDIAGITEVVEDGVTGCLAPARDADAFADRIGALLADPDRAAAIADRAAADVADRFSAERQYAEIRALYDGALAPRR